MRGAPTWGSWTCSLTSYMERARQRSWVVRNVPASSLSDPVLPLPHQLEVKIEGLPLKRHARQARVIHAPFNEVGWGRNGAIA